MVMPIVFVATFQATRSWGDLYFLLGFGIVGWIMKQLGWPRPPMVLGFVIGPDLRALSLSCPTRSTAARWMLRPVVIGIALIIAWALYRPLSQTRAHARARVPPSRPRAYPLEPRALFTLFVMAVATAALITSANWPDRRADRAAHRVLGGDHRRRVQSA